MSQFGMLRSAGINYDAGVLRMVHHVMAEAGISFAMGRGRVFYVDPVNGNDNNSGRTPRKAVATLAVGEALLTTGRHDTLVLIGGATAATITDTLDWDKNCTHLIGVSAPSSNPRAMIEVSGTDSAVAGLAVSGYGCIMANFKIVQLTSLAACGAISESGGRNYYWNVEIDGQYGANARGSATAYSLLLNNTEETKFDKCVIGLDAVVRSAGSAIRFAGSSCRNEFHNCIIRSACTTATVGLVKYASLEACDRYTWFDRCLFYNFYANHGAKLNEVFTIQANMATHDIILDNCMAVGFTQWAENDRGCIWVVGPAGIAGTAGSGSSGIAVEPS